MKRKKRALTVSAVCAAVILIVLVLALQSGSKSGNNASGTSRTSDGSTILTPVVEETEATVPPAKTEEAEVVTVYSAGTDSNVPVMARRADPSYFSDAAFVGNETVAALARYDYDGLLTGAAFYEVETVTDTSYINRIRNAEDVYGKVYIGLGGYELANRADDIRDSLTYAIEELRAINPDCIIYLMSVTPISKYRTSVNNAVRMDRIEAYNEMLSELAEEKNVWYLEITSALVDEEGYLPSNVTEDGLNFTPGHYEAWYDVIATRYIGD